MCEKSADIGGEGEICQQEHQGLNFCSISMGFSGENVLNEGERMCIC